MNEKEAVKDLKIDQIKSILAKLMSIYCWRPVMETDLVVKQVRKKTIEWDVRKTIKKWNMGKSQVYS